MYTWHHNILENWNCKLLSFLYVHTFSTAIRKVAKLDILNILNINIIAEVSLNISKSAKCQKRFILEGSNSTFTLQIIKTVFHANFSTNPQWRRWFWGTLWYFLKILEWQLWKCQVRTVWNILRHFSDSPLLQPLRWRKKCVFWSNKNSWIFKKGRSDHLILVLPT